MVECPIPQDILKYKSKFIMSLSVRETVFGALGVGLGLLSYFSWTSEFENQDMKMFVSFLVILPFFLIGFVKLYEQPFEKIAFTLVMENFVYPLKRKKEVHFPEFEKYEKTREWLIDQEDIEEFTRDAELQDGGKKKKSSLKKKNKNKPKKISVKKSETYKGIK